MRSKIISADAETLRTFDELREFRYSFFNSEFYFLLVVGRQGLAKSWEFEAGCVRSRITMAAKCRSPIT